MTGRGPAMAIALALAGCRDVSPAPETNIVAEEGLPPIPDIVPARGCADGWTVTIDRDSFSAGADGQPIPRDRLAAFEQSVVPAVRTAVNEACTAGEVDPAKAAVIRTLVVVNDTDRDTPKFYAAETDPSRTRLNDAFVSRDFAIPSEMELRQGMQCLTATDSPACQESIQ
jgi:hypothetical protein